MFISYARRSSMGYIRNILFQLLKKTTQEHSPSFLELGLLSRGVIFSDFSLSVVLGAYALFQLQEEMKRQLSAEGNYTEKELEEYMKTHKKVMIDSLWKLNVADIESTISRVCEQVVQLQLFTS